MSLNKIEKLKLLEDNLQSLHQQIAELKKDIHLDGKKQSLKAKKKLKQLKNKTGEQPENKLCLFDDFSQFEKHFENFRKEISPFFSDDFFSISKPFSRPAFPDFQFKSFFDEIDFFDKNIQKIKSFEDEFDRFVKCKTSQVGNQSNKHKNEINNSYTNSMSESSTTKFDKNGKKITESKRVYEKVVDKDGQKVTIHKTEVKKPDGNTEVIEKIQDQSGLTEKKYILDSEGKKILTIEDDDSQPKKKVKI